MNLLLSINMIYVINLYSTTIVKYLLVTVLNEFVIMFIINSVMIGKLCPMTAHVVNIPFYLFVHELICLYVIFFKLCHS